LEAVENKSVLSEVLMRREGAASAAKEAVLVGLGLAALVLAAKIRVPMWPVPVTM
jgi:biotin transport system substrate-specific component